LRRNQGLVAVCFSLLSSGIFLQACGSKQDETSSQTPSSALTADSTDLARLDLLKEVKALWEGSASSFCSIKARKLYTLRGRYFRLNTVKDFDDRDQNRSFAQELAQKGKLQEAIWVYQDIGEKKDFRAAKKLKKKLFNILSTSHFTASNLNPGGTTKKVLLFEHEQYTIRGVFKLDNQKKSLSNADNNAAVAAYRLDNLLNLNVVPMAVPRKMKRHGKSVSGVVSYFVSDTTPDSPHHVLLSKNIGSIKLLDYLIGYGNRKSDNMMFLPKMHWGVAIDNEAGFSSDCGSLDVLADYLELDADIRNKLFEVTPDQVRDTLKKYLSDSIVDKVVNRFEALQKELTELDICMLKYDPSTLDKLHLGRLTYFKQLAYCLEPSKNNVEVEVVVSLSPYRADVMTHSMDSIKYAQEKNYYYKDSSVNHLKRDETYNYVITTQGEIDFGRVRDRFEYGSKHLTLAQGRPILGAGEIRIEQDGQYEFNVQSGSIVLPLIVKYPSYEATLERSVRAVFLKEFGYSGIFGKQTLVPKTPPTSTELRSLCQFDVFHELNSHLCD
jgi:hypothetical protein